MIGLAIAAVVALYAIILYNGLVKARQVKEEAWSGIDVQLKRRADHGQEEEERGGDAGDHRPVPYNFTVGTARSAGFSISK